METHGRRLKVSRGASLAASFSSFSRKRISALIRLLFELFWWSALVWVVWNHALAGFLEAGGIGSLPSLAAGALLYALSALFNDSEPGEVERFPENYFR